jgi:hypothetical protein
MAANCTALKKGQKKYRVHLPGIIFLAAYFSLISAISSSKIKSSTSPWSHHIMVMAPFLLSLTQV